LARVVDQEAGSTTVMQRLACTMIGTALFVVCCLVGLLLTDALSPGRLPPMFAFYAACGAGLSLILGLVMLERRGVPHGGLAAYEGR
jgi:hypothetical protein